MKGKTKMEKGITLIALIITIVVLLILAAVAISSITNDGILQYATNAAKDYNQAVKNEQTLLQDYLDYLKVNDSNSSVLDGKGTETEPYIVSSVEDFILFAYDVNEGNSYTGKYVRLEKDLDFNSDASYENANRTNYARYGYEGNLKTALTSGEGFIPIGTTCNNGYEGKAYFAGTFDGNGKTISNLRINKENKFTTDIGIFTANLGEIKNLGVKNCDININCSENTNNYASLGVICGVNYGKINGCWTSGDMEVILNTAIHAYVGAIAGSGYTSYSEEVNISNCYNKANINVVQNNTTVSLYVGGIHGGSSNMHINNCYNIGNISGEHNGTPELRVGGIAGTVTTLSRCYNLGKIEGKRVSSTPIVGGIAGGCGGNTEYCCNVGDIKYEGTSAKYVGTLLGLTTETVSNSYTLVNAELNGIGRNYSSTPEPTKVNTVAEMPTVLEIVGSGFKADTNNINNGYPILSWQ